MKALKISADGTMKTVDLSQDDSTRLTQMQQAVGGYIEFVDLTEDVSLVLDEEGKLKRSPANRIASWIADAYTALIPGDVIVGDVLLVGVSADRDTAPLPNYILELVDVIPPLV